MSFLNIMSGHSNTTLYCITINAMGAVYYQCCKVRKLTKKKHRMAVGNHVTPFLFFLFFSFFFSFFFFSLINLLIFAHPSVILPSVV